MHHAALASKWALLAEEAACSPMVDREDVDFACQMATMHAQVATAAALVPVEDLTPPARLALAPTLV